MQRFRSLVTSFTDLPGLGVKGAVAAPLLDNFTKLGPPPTAFVSVGSSLAQLLALVYVFHFWSGLDRRAIDRRMKRALVLFVGLAATNFFLVRGFTEARGGGLEPVVTGYRIRPDVARMMTPIDTTRDLLEGAGFDATQVWTKTSVDVMATLLPISWIAGFAALSLFLGSFVMVQEAKD